MGNSKSKIVKAENENNWMYRHEWYKKGDIKVAILGIDAAGKTTLLCKLAAGHNMYIYCNYMATN